MDESFTSRIKELNILNWWSLNAIKFPSLSKLARDILAIPLSMVSSCSYIFCVGIGTKSHAR